MGKITLSDIILDFKSVHGDKYNYSKVVYSGTKKYKLLLNIEP